MQVSTAALLNVLSTKIDNDLKQKISTSSIDGKSDLSTLAKDKSIQTILNDIFKNLFTKDKSTTDIFQTLQNGKNLFDIKNLSKSLQNITTMLDKSTNPKLQQQSIILKEFFVNIENLDDKSLKNNFSNSGILFESKLKHLALLLKEPLLTNKIELQKNLEKLELNLKNILQNGLSVENVQNTKSTLKSINSFLSKNNIDISIKTAISDLLNAISKLPLDQNATLKKELLNPILDNLKNQNLSLLQDISKKINLLELKNDLNSLKDLSSPKDIKAVLDKIGANILKNDINPQIKNLSSNIITEFQNTQNLQNTNTKNNIAVLQQQIQALLNEPLKQEPNIKLADFSNPFKASALKQFSTLPQIQSLTNIQQGVEKIIQNLTDISQKGIDQLQIQNLKTNITHISSSLPKADLQLEIKTAVNNLLNQVNDIVKNPRSQTPLQFVQTVLNQASALNNTLLNTTININSLSQTPSLNITTDVKGSLLVILDQIEKGEQNIPKELKATVEKTITQVEYFQALSFTTASNHTFLPFSWENIDDGDIKFSKDSKDNFSCQINLNLKDQGEVKILLELDKKNYLNINMAVGEQSFKSDIQENLQTLRKSINDINLNLQSLNVFDLNVKASQNPYSNTQTLNLGLDLKA